MYIMSDSLQNEPALVGGQHCVTSVINNSVTKLTNRHSGIAGGLQGNKLQSA